MAIQQFMRADRPYPAYQYIAHRLGGLFDPLPSWFQVLERQDLWRVDEDGMGEVREITGTWRPAVAGQWVVLQRNGYAYLVDDEDFNNLWKPVE